MARPSVPERDQTPAQTDIPLQLARPPIPPDRRNEHQQARAEAGPQLHPHLPPWRRPARCQRDHTDHAQWPNRAANFSIPLAIPLAQVPGYYTTDQRQVNDFLRRLQAAAPKVRIWDHEVSSATPDARRREFGADEDTSDGTLMAVSDYSGTCTLAANQAVIGGGQLFLVASRDNFIRQQDPNRPAAPWPVWHNTALLIMSFRNPELLPRIRGGWQRVCIYDPSYVNEGTSDAAIAQLNHDDTVRLRDMLFHSTTTHLLRNLTKRFHWVKPSRWSQVWIGGGGNTLIDECRTMTCV